MTDDTRAEMKAARDAGKAIHQAQRLENATYTAVEVKALTKTAADVAYALGRKEAAGEIATAIEDAADALADISSMPAPGYYAAAKIAREIGTKEGCQ